MTKIGNGNGFICGLHSKPHTVRAQNTLRSSGILPIHSRKLTQMTKIGNGNGLICGLLKFRKWFKNGLKAQKLLLPFQGVWSLHAKVENLISSIKIKFIRGWERRMKLCEGDDAGRIPPFATRLLGMIAALTKDKYATMELNNVNGGVNELIKKVLFTFVLSLERSIALMTSVDC